MNRNEVKLREAAYALLDTEPTLELFTIIKSAGDLLGIPVQLEPGNGWRDVLINGKHVGGIVTT